MKYFTWTILISLLMYLPPSPGQGSEPASYFRHDGGVAADDRRLPDDFEDDRMLVWRQELAPGHSTPCISGDLIFLTTFDADASQLATLALHRDSGVVRWRKTVPTSDIEPFHPVGSPAACTIACDGRQLYVFFGSYGLICYALDGEPQWTHRMGPFQDEFGASSSPILVDGKVILNQDHDINSFLIAIDQLTGETVWKVPRDGFTRSYSTPIVWDFDNEKVLVVAGALQLAAYDIKDGGKRWWVNGLSRIVDTTPIVADGILYVATQTMGGDQANRISMESFSDALDMYDKNGNELIDESELSEGPVLLRFFRIDLNQNGSLEKVEWDKYARVFQLAQNAALAIRPGGEGDVTSTHVEWIQRKGLPTVPSPVVYKGVVYMVKNSGIVTSLDASTGAMLRRGRISGRGNYYASPVAGDGKIYLPSERGVVTVISAGKKWSVLSSHDFGERILASPVIADGRIYLRTDAALYCFAHQ